MALIIESSYSIYRERFEISNNLGNNITLNKKDFLGNIEISAFAFATKDITINSDEFDDFYKTMCFEIEKYDILAINDGYTIKIEHDEVEDNFVGSIFSIIVNRSDEQRGFSVDYSTGKKIIISLSQKDYNNYKIIYNDPNYKEIFFGLLLIPALIEALNACKSFILEKGDLVDFDDVEDNFVWFKSIIRGFNKLSGEELTIEKFIDKPSSYWAQELLACPIEKALENMIVSNKGEDDNE